MATQKWQKRRVVHKRPQLDPTAADYDESFEDMPDHMKLRRQRFVHEYIKDFNGSAAMQRLGYKSKQPWVHASELLHEPYTQWYLAKIMQEMDAAAIVTKNDILFGLKKEANYHGPDASQAGRVGAWRSLAKALGMETVKVEAQVQLGGGVMLVPSPGTPEDWEKATSAAQAKLKSDVRK